MTASCSTVAVSDAIAREIDNLELALDIGPCLDAMKDGTAQLEPDLTVGGRWPGLAARVVAETPVRGALSVRMPVDRSKVGALNLFSDTPNAFDDSSLDGAIVLGAFATVATNAAAHDEEAETLRRGLTSNRAIGKAVGMLMVLQRRVGRRRFRHSPPDSRKRPTSSSPRSRPTSCAIDIGSRPAERVN